MSTKLGTLALCALAAFVFVRPALAEVAMPYTWPAVYAHRVSPSEARNLNIYFLDRYGALGSLPYRLAVALGLPESRKQQLVNFWSSWTPYVSRAPSVLEKTYGPVVGSYSEQRTDTIFPNVERSDVMTGGPSYAYQHPMEDWFLVDRHPLLDQLLPGMLLYLTPSRQLILRQVSTDTVPPFGPGDSLFTNQDEVNEFVLNRLRAASEVDAACLTLLFKSYSEVSDTTLNVGHSTTLVFPSLTILRAVHGVVPTERRKGWRIFAGARLGEHYVLLRYRRAGSDSGEGGIAGGCETLYASIDYPNERASFGAFLASPIPYWTLSGRLCAVARIVSEPRLTRLHDRLYYLWRETRWWFWYRFSDAQTVLDLMRVLTLVLATTLVLALAEYIRRLLRRRRWSGKN
jgi:hypothetical protein